jgi:hypothetical protein
MPASAFVVIGNGWLEYCLCPFWKVVGSGIERVVKIVAVLEEERHSSIEFAPERATPTHLPSHYLARMFVDIGINIAFDGHEVNT